MSPEYVHHAARRPRYAVVTPGILVEVQSAADSSTGPVQAELRDLSRNGFQVKLPVPAETRAPLSLRLRIEGSGIDVTLRGIVRWQRPTEDGAWLAGCEADCPIDWETLGDLFLGGILSTDAG